MKTNITFYYLDLNQKHLFEYIAKHLNKRKYKINFSNNLNYKSDIGFYAEDSNYLKNINCKVSIICLGGMDQGKLFWPNLWKKESWSRFDFGMLPGEKWAQMWKRSSWYEGSRPKQGMLLTGWPKTSELYKYQRKKNKKFKTILYAPCFETDNKGIDVVNALIQSKYKLLIKHLPWDQKTDLIKFRDVRENIKKMEKYAKIKLRKSVKIINSKENIMKYYSKADLLITDESSVIYEALLFNLPSLSCIDWPMRINNSNKPRKINPDYDVCNYTSKIKLKQKIREIINNNKKFKNRIIDKKKFYFSYINDSAKNISVFLDNFLDKGIIKFKLNPSFKINSFKSKLIDLIN
tara:strand:+ start:770 stop:1816 length:1047 start_codon:yes stop_codon:yes gene_type:complete